MSIDRQQLDQCERLALNLAPELQQSPLYFLNMPANHQIDEACVAFTTRGATNFLLRDALISAGRWRGPGPTICVSDKMAQDQLVPYSLHEVAHCLPHQPPQKDFEPPPFIRELQLFCIKSQFDRISNSPSRPRWGGGHDLPFIRACLHLHYRARQFGYEVGAGDMLFAGPAYDLSPHWMYLRAIKNEPARMKAELFHTIQAEPYPTEFLNLWRFDVARWYHAHPAAIGESTMRN